MAATPASPFVHYGQKYNQSADILVMLDNSWSIGRTNYFFQKEFLYKFIERIDTDKVHLSAISYSSYPKVEFYFKNRGLYASPANRRKKILSKLKWRGGETGIVVSFLNKGVKYILYNNDTNSLKNLEGRWNGSRRRASNGGLVRVSCRQKL